MTSKIQEHHRERPACIYIRQSTLGQVRHHQESTERQYALKTKALELAWSPSAIRILDGDLGQSGAQATDRADFKTLVTDVSMGRVGAVFALEASRLARSDLDWHRLIEICAITQTLVIDEDGCYDPADFNDALLLAARAEGHHCESGTALHPRAPPGWEAEQGQARGVAVSLARRFQLRRRRSGGARSGPRGAGSRAIDLAAVSRNGECLRRGSSTSPRTGCAFPSARTVAPGMADCSGAGWVMGACSVC